MIRISDSQAEAFAADADRAFVTRQVKRIREVFGEAAPANGDEAALCPWVEDKVAYAVTLQFVTEPHVEDFVDLCVLDDDLAERSPDEELAEVLEDFGLPAWRRMELARRMVFFPPDEDDDEVKQGEQPNG